MDSDPNWENNLGKSLDYALAGYARGVQEEAQAEVDKLDVGLTVPTFAKPRLSTEVTAGKTYDTTGEDFMGGLGLLSGSFGGMALGSAIFPGVDTVVGSLLGDKAARDLSQIHRKFIAVC
jgi:hypothetical protein